MDIKLRTPRGDVVVKQSPLDKVIAYISPTTGINRMRAKTQMALAGGYTGASSTRRSLKSWVAGESDADSALLDDLPDLRERSSDLIRNSPLGGGIVNTVVTNVVGPGLTLKSEIDADYLGLTEEQATAFEDKAERLFELYSQKEHCDITKTQSRQEMEALVLRSVLESGDTFTLLPTRRSKSPFSTKIQLIEAHRVVNKDNASDESGLSGGIQTNSDGAPVAYHIMTTHPGSDNNFESEWQVIPAFGRRSGRRNVLHHYKKLRPGQSRGVPYLATVIESLKQLERYTNAELMAAVISGMFTVFVKTESGDELDLFSPNDETNASASDEDYALGNGAIVQMGANDDISVANPGRPNAVFDQFVLAVVRQIGVNLELPYEILLKHFTASYSAARGAVLEAWRFFLDRRVWLSRSFSQPVYEAFMDEMVGKGMLSAPGYFSDPLIKAAYNKALWIGRPAGQIDPFKEMKANQLAEQMGWKTATENTIELTGGNWVKKNRQRTKENELMIESGLKPDPTELEESGETEEDNS